MYLSLIPCRLTLLAAALATALSAHAQQAETAPVTAPAKQAPAAKPAADDKIQQVEIKGSAETYDPRRDDTASKIVVNHEEIVKFGDTNVMDVLKRLPGVTVTGANGRSGGEVRMRGLGSGYTQILLNGERAPAGFSLDSLAPDVIERIEVLRAASAEFSTQSIAGTINIVLKKAIKAGQREVKYGVGAGAGTVNPTLNVQISDRAGPMSYSVAVNAIHQRFRRESPTVEEGVDATGKEIMLRNTKVDENGHFTALNIAPRVNWNLKDGDTITWQTFINVNRFAIDPNAVVDTPVGLPPQYPRINAAMTNENEFFRTDLNWVHKFGSQAKLDLKVGGLVGGLGNEQHRFGFGAAGKEILDSAIHSKGTDHGYSSTGKFSTPIVEGHALAMGWDGGVNTRDDARKQVESTFDGTRPTNTDERFKSDVKRLALYAQDEWNVTPRWSVYLGARWEGIDTTTSGNTFATAKSSSSVWSPLMQTLYKLPDTKGDQVRFAVTRTYKAPNTQQLIPRRFTSVNNSSTDPDFQGNPDLKPELATGIDASYEHYWGEGALISVSTSMRRIDAYTRSKVIFDGARWVQLPMNDGRANTRGLELEAKFPLKSVMDNAPAIDLRASLSRNWSTVDSVPGPNNRLDQQTPFSATLGADYKLGQFTAGGSYAFKNGGQVRISQNQTSYVSVRRDLDVYGLWKFDAKNQLRLAVSNVLGQDFINENSYGDQNGSVHRRSIFPAVTIFRATMETKF